MPSFKAEGRRPLSSEERYLASAKWSLSHWSSRNNERHMSHGYTIRAPWQVKPTVKPNSKTTRDNLPTRLALIDEAPAERFHAYFSRLTPREAMDAGVPADEAHEHRHHEVRLRTYGNSRIGVLRQVCHPVHGTLWLILHPIFRDHSEDGTPIPGTEHRKVARSITAAIRVLSIRRAFFRPKGQANGTPFQRHGHHLRLGRNFVTR